MPSAARRVDHRRAGDGAAVAAERVVPLLVRRDEQDLAPHQLVPFEKSSEVLEGVAGGAADDERHRVGIGVDGVDDEARPVAEVEHVEGAEVLLEEARRDPVLEAAEEVVDG